MPSEKHAVYAVCHAYNGERLSFRIGLPIDWHRAQNRWNRLDAKRRAGVAQAIRFMRRQYRADFFEVRAVDFNGRGLGGERHALAFPVPYRELSR